uniref:Uncharacterized protein n=1 Tax=Physcomitrium patens TaxID=3218 RepID=A0A2K1KX67_PHYPA|nr:hypothetical protein PHYPA_005341 [Physcomitrium patens]
MINLLRGDQSIDKLFRCINPSQHCAECTRPSSTSLEKSIRVRVRILNMRIASLRTLQLLRYLCQQKSMAVYRPLTKLITCCFEMLMCCVDMFHVPPPKLKEFFCILFLE